MIRVGILGAAKIAPKALIHPARQRGEVDVRYVAARDPLRAAAFAASHRLRAEQSYGSLIARNDIDLVYVALPPAAHCEWSIKALEAGKAVLCEKPFALSAEEACRMVAAERACGRPLIEAFHYRFHQAMKRALELVRSDALGRVTYARAGFGTRISYSPEELRWSAAQGGGAVMDLGCYPIHALRTLLGEEPSVLSATAEFAYDVEAQATAKLAFPSGATADVWCSLVSPTIVWDLELVGKRGRLLLSNYIAPQFGCTLSTRIGGVLQEEQIMGPSTYEAQLAHVIDVLQHGAATLTGGDDAVANMMVIDEIRTRARELGAPAKG